MKRCIVGIVMLLATLAVAKDKDKKDKVYFRSYIKGVVTMEESDLIYTGDCIGTTVNVIVRSNPKDYVGTVDSHNIEGCKYALNFAGVHPGGGGAFAKRQSFPSCRSSKGLATCIDINADNKSIALMVYPDNHQFVIVRFSITSIGRK
jgi:hypothetical protein